MGKVFWKGAVLAFIVWVLSLAIDRFREIAQALQAAIGGPA